MSFQKLSKSPKVVTFWLIFSLCVAVVGVGLFNLMSLAGDLSNADIAQTVQVERVVDGDTIVVNQDGFSKTVRLIGIDAPESVNPNDSKNTPEGKTASEFLSTVLTERQTIYLQKDTSDKDKYGRWLRYVYTKQPTIENLMDYQWLQNHMLNAILVSVGHAKAKEYPPDTKYSKFLASVPYLGVSI